MKPLRTTSALLAFGFSALLFTSCIEDSTVIRINKDGSGKISARSYISPQVAQMMGGIGASLGAEPEGADAGAPPEKPMMPDEEELKANAATYGEGVRYVQMVPGKNTKGWDGFVAVYEFDDVSQLRIDPYKTPSPGEGGEDVAAGATENPVTFSMNDGLLTINITPNSDTLEGLSGPGGGDEEMQMPMEMMIPMLDGMRLGTFIRIDGGIAETNAQHVNGTMITLSDFQPAKMLKDPGYEALSKEAEALGATQPDDAAIKAMMKKVQAIEGVQFETQEQVTVRFE